MHSAHALLLIVALSTIMCHVSRLCVIQGCDFEGMGVLGYDRLL